MPGRPATVTVAVPTFRRPAQLAELLPALGRQAAALVAASGGRHRVELLVVDNDPAGSALPVVRAAAVDARYVHEPRPGISAARNRALCEAADSDLLVFIDDDELPGPSWLRRLVDGWHAWGCAAVTGPVVSRLGDGVDPWVAGSGVFDRTRRPTGTALHGGATNNLLLDLAQVRALGLAFDERLGLTGGEDTMFTHTLVRRGGDIRWCDEAEVGEAVPPERLTRRWVRRRSFRSGSSWSRAEIHLAGGPWARARLRAVLCARAAVRGTQAGLRLAAAACRGDLAGRGRSVCTLAGYAGLVAGAFGYVYGEYARPSASLGAAPHVVPL